MSKIKYPRNMPWTSIAETHLFLRLDILCLKREIQAAKEAGSKDKVRDLTKQLRKKSGEAYRLLTKAKRRMSQMPISGILPYPMIPPNDSEKATKQSK